MNIQVFNNWWSFRIFLVVILNSLVIQIALVRCRLNFSLKFTTPPSNTHEQIMTLMGLKNYIKIYFTYFTNFVAIFA